MNFEQFVDDKNIISLLENDDISRNSYLLKFLQIINNNGRNKIFSLNGNWGSGKTIFVKKLDLLIKYCYMYSDKKLLYENLYSKCEEMSEESLERMEKLVQNGSYLEFDKIVKENLINCVYFNAWEHDDEDDPIISLIFEMIKKYNLIDETKSSKINILQSLNLLIKSVTKSSLDFTGIIKNENLSEFINRKENVKLAVNNTIDSLINENCNKLILFIDELDRCTPKYAIKLLERIKHYFNDERLVIVISTNLLELSSSVSAIYGERFSSSAYLDKFFDIRLELPEVSSEKYINTLDTMFKNNDNRWFSISVMNYINEKRLQPREINRYLGCLKFFESFVQKDKDYSFQKFQLLIDYCFIPYVVGLYVTDIKEYNNFKLGTGWQSFKDFILSSDSLCRFCKNTLYTHQNDNSISNDAILEEVKKLYNIIFNRNHEDKISDIIIGNQKIYYNFFDNFENKISLLGALADFQTK